MLLRIMLVAAVAAFGFAGAASASIIQLGSVTAFGGTNLPGACTNTSCSDPGTFGNTTTIDGGALTLTTSQVADGPNAEWDLWRITTTGGGPVAGNINGYWNIKINYTLSVAADFDRVVNQWSVGGTPVSGLANFGVCCAVASNPSPLSGPAYYNSGFNGPLPAGTQTGWQQIFVNPYDYVAAGNIDPSTADGFAFGLHFTRQTPVPEPGSLAVLAAALLGLGLVRRRYG